MLHKMILCCNVCLQLSFVAQNCIRLNREKTGNSPIFIIMCMFCVEDAISTHHPPPIQQASECEPCQILIVAGKRIMGSRETECSHGDGQSTVVVAMRRVLAASVVCVYV